MAINKLHSNEIMMMMPALY